MRAIKKVSVTPVASNTGTIIDSMNTGDDKHTNAPSINAVTTYVGNQLEPIQTHSTNETVVGTWVDGKTIYRKGFSGTFTTSNIRTDIQLNENGTSERVVNVYGSWSPSSSTDPVISINTPVMLSINGGVDAYASISVNSAKALRLLIYSQTYSGSTGSYEITVDYTKPTNTAQTTE